MTTTTAPAPAATREAYGPALVKLAEAGHDIVALDADLSASTGGNKLAGSFPDRWFTVGAAEANMISIAAGLASTGKTVYAASFAVFMPGHCFDQIRVHIAQQRMNVKLIASHGGISVGEDGASAQAIEDLALMTSLPGMNVVVPCDSVEADAMIRRAADDDEPWYIRLGRPKLPVVYTEGASFQLGKAHQLRDGRDVTLIACGLMVEPTLRAADALAKEGIGARVLNMATIKPLDDAEVIRAAEQTGAQVVGPVPLPTRIEKFTVMRSPFIDKDSREQFEIRTHKRLIDVVDPGNKTIENLTRLNLPAGVDIEIKL